MSSVIYSRLDQALAEFLSARCGLEEGDKRALFRQLVLDLSAAQGAGHSCLFVDESQQALLLGSSMVSGGERNTPLVLEGNRLYLQRYWQYESRLVSHLQQRLQSSPSAPDNLTALLDQYFPLDPAQNETDWQREAAAAACQQVFSMITGGPGTGKTTTVLKILALLQEIHQGHLAISLAAPTGKAAMRLQQSLMEGKQNLPLSDALLEAIPEKVSTLHRLLGAINQSTQFRHHAHKPLSCDLLVIDEASMIDLALMSKVIDALHPDARLILLGDQDQLASVESGAVLSDLCVSLPKHTLKLKKTWRFDGPIKALATAVNQCQATEAWDILQDPSQAVVNWVSEEPVAHIEQHYQAYIQLMTQAPEPAEAFAAFSQFQVLAAVRQGTQGVEGLNTALEKRLQLRGILVYRTWYHGRPIMINRNDPALGLFNGDIGLCLYDATLDQQRVWFEQSDGNYRAVMPGRLPEHETVYVMTIHKSQGSEFAHVMVVLPENKSPLLSRELLYTAITRAKQRVDIAADQAVFTHTVRQQVQRHSGLPIKMQSVKS